MLASNGDSTVGDKGEGADEEVSGPDEESPPIRMVPLLVGVFTVGPVILSVMKLVAVSRGDPHSLLVLLRTLNVVPLVASILLAPAGVWLVAIGLFFAGLHLDERLAGRVLWLIGGVVIAILMVSARFALEPWVRSVYMGAWLVGLVLGFRSQTLAQRRKPSPGGTSTAVDPRSAPELHTGMIVGIVLCVMTTTRTPWLPPEVISHGNETETLYVLDEGDMGLSALRPDGSIKFIPFSAITERQYCQSETTDRAFIFQDTPAHLRAEDEGAPSAALPKCPE